MVVAQDYLGLLIHKNEYSVNQLLRKTLFIFYIGSHYIVFLWWQPFWISNSQIYKNKPERNIPRMQHFHHICRFKWLKIHINSWKSCIIVTCLSLKYESLRTDNNKQKVIGILVSLKYYSQPSVPEISHQVSLKLLTAHAHIRSS